MASTTARPRPLLVLIDGHSLVHRAYHAVPAGFMTSRGEPTNAVYGFTSMLLKVLNDYRPDYCAVAFDRSAPTFRHLASAEYKATRPRLADDLRPQFARVREVIQAFGIPIYERDGYEADDLLGCLASQASRQGLDTLIVTGDLDSLQLVDEHVRVLAPRGRMSDTVIYDAPAVRERYGLEPYQLPDFKALAGDASDNIKGVPGVGPKTATRLLADFGTIEDLYARLDDVPAKLRQPLAAHQHLVRRNKQLATIDRQAPCVLELDACRLDGFDRQRLLALFRELEFRSLMDRLPRPAPGVTEGPQGPVQPAQTARPAAPTGGAVAPRPPADAAEPATAPPTRLDPEYQMSFFGDLTGAKAPDSVTVAAPDAAVIVTSPDQLRAALDAIRRAGSFVLHPIAHQRSVIDYEIAGVALALDAQRAWYVPLASSAAEQSPSHSGLDERAALEGLRPALEDPAIQKLAHNAKVIFTMLAERGLRLQGVAFDTMVGAYLLNPTNRTTTVHELVFQQMGREIEGVAALVPKGATVLDVPVERAAPAAVLEAQLLCEIARELRAELADRAQLELFERVEMPLVPILSSMERAGIKVDERILAEMGRELAQQIRNVELEIYNCVGHQFTINSPQQLGKVLVEELHLPLTKRTKTGYSTDATVLEELLGVHPIIELVLTYRQLTKLKSTYIDALPALIHPRTGRVHTTFNQTVTATGRLSSDSPNLQNIPVRTELGRLIRRAFVAGEADTLLLAADYSQIELRIAAHITRDPLLIKAFQEGLDVHTATAATIFGVPVDQVTPEQRRLAKTTNFAVLYGISDFGLSQRVGIARSEAAPFIKAYLERHTGIRQYIERTLRQARERGYVETPLGRRRYLPELRSANASVRAAGERMAINMPIQGAQADLIKLAMIAVFREFEQRRLRSRMLLQVHDELLFEVPRAELDEVAALVRDCMEHAMQLIVPIQVDMKVGPNWYDMEPYGRG
jgi:DNA polymerase-1